MADEQVTTTTETAAPEAAVDLGSLNLWGGGEPAEAPEPAAEASEGEGQGNGAGGEEKAASAAEAAPKEAPKTDKAAELPETWQKFVDEISRRDTELKQRERRLGQLEKAAQDAERYRGVVEKLKTDPLAAIQEVGGDPTVALQKAFGIDQAPVDPALKAIRDEIAALRQEREQERQYQAQSQQQHQIQQARHAVLQQFSDMAKGAGERYPHLAIFHQQLAPAEMFAVAEAHAKATGQWMPDEEAASIAEGRLKQQVEGLLDILGKSPQYASRFVAAVQAAQDGAGQPASKAEIATPPRGLRNKHTAESSSAVDDDFDPSDERAVLERAAQMFESRGGWGKKKA